MSSPDASILATPRWRSAGPARGGRSVAVAGHPTEQGVFFMGACGGGVWKTTDAGVYWRNVSDGFLRTSPIGAIAVAHTRPDTVWAGTGEACVRNNVMAGDGVYASHDGGKTWQHRGLDDTRHIARVRIERDNPDTVWVAALGDIFGPSSERGVFRTRDGGETWDHLLHVSDDAGAADLCLDDSDPNVAFASIWQAVRHPWEMVSGGEHSDLYRTLDGGATWEPMSASPGFPTALKGRIGVAISPVRPERVYAVVEAAEEQSGIYRSDDRGATWTRINTDVDQTGRPWYYSHVFADPVDADTVYTCNLWFWRSRDGGETFDQVQTPHGDNHDLWLDPANPQRMAQGNDGGACVSFNGGQTFSSVYNQATSQLYRIDVERQYPFDLFATQQDNSGIRVPSRSWKGLLRWTDCTELGEAEAGDVAVDPADPRFVFLGGAGFGHPGPLLRYDQYSEQPQDVAVSVEHFMGTDPVEHSHRFGWTYPIRFSPHDPSLLYVGGERLFRTRDAGMSWEPASPDLTRNDPSKLMASGGPINKDTSGAEVYCTIHAFAESAVQQGILWVGTDDGLVHVSTDDGVSWADVTPPELPEFATVVTVEPSHHDAHTVYVAAHNYRLQDRAPHVFESTDLGRTWTSLRGDLPDVCVARCIRQDPSEPDVLYLGHDTGLAVTVDRGAHWLPLGAELPPVPVYDIALRDQELVAGTHGRGFWIFDDLTPVRELRRDDGELTLHTPPLTYRAATPNGFAMAGEGTWVGGMPGVPVGGGSFTPEKQPDGSIRNVVIDGGENPPNGLAVWYRLASDVDSVRVEIRTGDGALLRTILGAPEAGRPEPELPLPGRTTGLHRVLWDLRIEPALKAPEDDGTVEAVTPGPRVPPGRYEVVVVAGSERRTAEVTVVRDPRIFSDDSALTATYDLLVEVRDRLADIGRAVTWLRTSGDPRAGELERSLVGTAKTHGDELKMPPGLVARISLLPEIVAELSDTAPTQAVRSEWARLQTWSDTVLSDVETLGWTR